MNDQTRNPLSDFTSDVEVQSTESPAATEPTWEEVQSRSKSLEDQLANAQRLIGEQGRQLGEYRSLLSERQEESSSQSNVSDDDFITKPIDAVNRMLESRLSKYEDEIRSLRQERAVSEFEQRHPEAREVLSSQEFVSWANRPENHYLAQRAADGDLDAADSLLTMYNTSRPPASDDRAAPPPTTERSSAAPTTSVAKGTKPISREKYRQAMMRGERIPPEVMAEIHGAYKSGNVI